MKKENNEELQSRRDFFKKAAQKALPILGAVILSTTPLLSQATTHEGESQQGCSSGCWSSCSIGCSMSCTGSCSSGCSGSCYGECKSGCLQSCYGTCSGGCARSEYA